MSNKITHRNLVDFSYPAASIVSGAISGVTPKVSSWVQVKRCESIAVTLTTTGTANGVWTCEVSNDETTVKVGVNRATMDKAPTFPTGTSQNSTVTLYTLGYKYFRLTFTPSAGAGNADAAVGLIVGAPLDIAQVHFGSMFLYIPAADNLVGTWLCEVSNDWSGIGDGQSTTAANGQWADIVSSGDPAITNPSGSGQSLAVRMGILEFGAIRMKYTPTSGFGSGNCSFVGKAA